MRWAAESGHYTMEFLQNTALKAWVSCTAVPIRDRSLGTRGDP